MGQPLKIKLSDEQRQELAEARDQHPKPYMRERCAAILKIAHGQSGLSVAQHGLYKVRAADTVYEWVRRYEQAGLPGLTIKPGRGRKPGFSPSK